MRVPLHPAPLEPPYPHLIPRSLPLPSQIPSPRQLCPCQSPGLRCRRIRPRLRWRRHHYLTTPRRIAAELSKCDCLHSADVAMAGSTCIRVSGGNAAVLSVVEQKGCAGDLFLRLARSLRAPDVGPTGQSTRRNASGGNQDQRLSSVYLTIQTHCPDQAIGRAFESASFMSDFPSMDQRCSKSYAPWMCRLLLSGGWLKPLGREGSA